MILPWERMQLERRGPRIEPRGGSHLRSRRRETSRERTGGGRGLQKRRQVSRKRQTQVRHREHTDAAVLRPLLKPVGAGSVKRRRHTRLGLEQTVMCIRSYIWKEPKCLFQGRQWRDKTQEETRKDGDKNDRETRAHWAPGT